MIFSAEIKNYMTKVPHAVGVDQPLSIAREMMSKYEIRHLPVRDAGKLVGVISDRDITFAMAVDRKSDEELKVNDVQTEDPYVAAPSTSVQEVVEQLASQRIGCAIIEEKGEVVGIFTVVDALDLFCSIMQEKAA